MMDDQTLFRRITGITAIVSVPLALGASGTVVMSLGADPDIIADPTKMVALGPQVGATFRLAEFVGLIGYALLLLPLILYLWSWLKPRSPQMVTLYTVFGMGYIFVGILASATFITLIPPLMDAFAVAAEPEREMLTVVFATVMELGFAGLLGLSAILGGIWQIGIGTYLRQERSLLGIAAILFGIISLGYGIGEMLQFNPLLWLEPGTFLATLWVLWIGIAILRGAGQQQMEASAS